MLHLSRKDFIRYVAVPCLLYAILFFGSSELIEHLLMNKFDEATLHVLHFLRGVFSVMFVAAIVIFSLSRAEKNLNRRLESVCSLLNLAQEGLIAFNSSWNVIALNQRAKELIGNTLTDEFAKWTEEIRLRMSDTKIFEHTNPQGNRKLKLRALQSFEGGFLVLINDVTEERKREEQWLIAEKMASVGRMAAGLAHEIGTPLNIILGRAEIIQAMEAQICRTCAAKPACGVEKHVAIILDQIERISSIIHQLLSQAREPSGRQDQFSLNECVRKVYEFLQPVMENQHVTIRLHLKEDLPFLYGFKDQFQQVLINLLTNSIDAMEGKKGQICVSTDVGEQGLTLTVLDEGCGIHETNLTKIFDPFFTTKEFGKGTGLGLTVTSNIIRSHGGTIDVQSRLNQGTKISIHLPVHNSPAVNHISVWRQ